MDLVKIYKEQGNIRWLEVDDEGERFPIRLTSLHNPTVLDSLLENDWILCGLPYDIRKGSLTIEQLPSEERSESSFSAMELQDMEDTDQILYDTIDLRSKLKHSDTFLELKIPEVLLNTRTELIEFLDTFDSTEVESESPFSYMPLNSFTSPAALFTVQEYLSPENSRYRNIIEKRRILSIRQARRLEMMFLSMGMSKDFNSHDLCDFYFSWGICGIRTEVSSRGLYDTEFPLYDTSSVMNDAARIRQFDIGYFSRTGLVVEGSKRHRLLNGDGEARELRNHIDKTQDEEGFDIVIPVVAYTNIRVPVTSLSSSSVIYEYDDTTLRITYNNKQHIFRALNIKNPYFGDKLLHFEYWNLHDTSKFYRELQLRTLCSEVVSRVTDACKVSSFQVLSKMGASPANVLRYFANNAPIQETDDEDEDGKSSSPNIQTIIEGIESYLEGVMTDENPAYANIQSFVTQCIQGEINVDNIAQGVLMDEYEDPNIYTFLYAAMKYLNKTFDELVECVSRVSIDNPVLDIEGNNLHIRYKLSVRNNRKAAIKLDEMIYSGRMAVGSQRFADPDARVGGVSHVILIERVYREVTPKGFKPRHIAVRFLDIPMVKWNDSLDTWVNDVTFEALLEKMNAHLRTVIDQKLYKQRDFLYPRVSAMVMYSLFEIAMSGCSSCLKSFGLDSVEFPVEAKQALNNRMLKKTESLYGLTEHSIAVNGEFAICCVNATLSPLVVIPHKGVVLKEYPFLPNFLNKVGYPEDILNAWISKSWIDSNDLVGDQPYYSRQAILPHRNVSYNLEDYRASLDKHRANYTGGQFEPITHPFFNDYPELSSLYPEVMYSEDAIAENPIYFNGEMRTIYSDIIFKEYPFLLDIYDIDQNSRLLGNNMSVVKGLNFSVGELKTMSGIEDTHIFDSFAQNKLQLVEIKNNSLMIFIDGTTVNITDLDTTDISKYPIQRLRAGKYLVETMRGKCFTITM